MSVNKTWSEHANSTSSYMEDLRLEGFYVKVYGDGSWYVFQDNWRDDNEKACKSWGRQPSVAEAKERSIKVYELLKQLKELEGHR